MLERQRKPTLLTSALQIIRRKPKRQQFAQRRFDLHLPVLIAAIDLAIGISEFGQSLPTAAARRDGFGSARDDDHFEASFARARDHLADCTGLRADAGRIGRILDIAADMDLSGVVAQGRADPERGVGGMRVFADGEGGFDEVGWGQGGGVLQKFSSIGASPRNPNKNGGRKTQLTSY